MVAAIATGDGFAAKGASVILVLYQYSVSGAVLVYTPTLEGWQLLQGQAGAISRTTGIYALLFGRLRRREGERGEIGVAHIGCSRTR